MSESTSSTEVSSPNVGSPCPRCSELRSLSFATEHLCKDLSENWDFNPFKIDIDVSNISNLLREIENLQIWLDPLISHDDLSIETRQKIDEFALRLEKCHASLQKLQIHYAPYLLNEWDAEINRIEQACKMLETRIPK